MSISLGAAMRTPGPACRTCPFAWRRRSERVFTLCSYFYFPPQFARHLHHSTLSVIVWKMEGKAKQTSTEPKKDYVELCLVPVPSDVTQLELLEQQLPLVRKLCAADSDCDTELEDGRAWKASKACAYVEGVEASKCASSSLPCTRPSKGFLPFPKLEPHPAHRATLSSEVRENSETPAGRAAGGPGGDGNSPTLSTSTFVVSLDVASGERNVKAAERAESLGWPPREPGVSSFFSLKRSSFVVKALPCAQGELFPLLSKEGGMRLDMRLDIERTVAEMGALLHIGGHWHDPLHGKFAICSVVQDAKNKMSCRMFSIKDGPLSEKVKVELTQQRHTSSRACVDQKMVVDVNEALAACLLALPNTIWIKPPTQWGPHVQLAMSQKYRLTSANVFGGIDLNFSSLSKELDLVRLEALLGPCSAIYTPTQHPSILTRTRVHTLTTNTSNAFTHTHTHAHTQTRTHAHIAHT